MNLWHVYEQMKKSLPPLSPGEYEQAIKEIAERLGL